jgi:NifU-like protein involved in Fe-S cluster formation
MANARRKHPQIRTDIMQMFIKVNESKINAVKFKAFGCGLIIAKCPNLTERVKGTPLMRL